jgi:hypothetical protein
MMMLIAPTRQYLSEYRFATPIGGEWNHYINVVIPTSAIPSLWINGNQVSSDLFNPIGSGVYSVASLRLSFGSFSINADQPFGLSSYGFGYRSQAYDAYGNVGGQAYYGLPLNVQEK